LLRTILIRLHLLCSVFPSILSIPFFFNAPPTTKIYPLSLHDALPIYELPCSSSAYNQWFASNKNQTAHDVKSVMQNSFLTKQTKDRKSTRLNSSHVSISYAVFCLKKKK